MVRKSAVDDDDAPELDESFFERARPMTKVLPPEAQRAFRGGRPRLERPKKQVTVRLDADVLEAMKATGPRWQTRVNAVLRASLATGAFQRERPHRVAGSKKHRA
ncbi:MAG: BrnA antitoxin family protein [Alphaproteobacteria bacterium]|nr:BrnA antitoxin family protein [Alphaproteobacteria bacterium]